MSGEAGGVGARDGVCGIVDKRPVRSNILLCGRCCLFAYMFVCALCFCLCVCLCVCSGAKMFVCWSIGLVFSRTLTHTTFSLNIFYMKYIRLVRPEA